MMNVNIDEYRTKSQTVEKGIFVGPYSKGIALLETLHSLGWHITRSGPYTDGKMFPKCDSERFLIHAERVLEEKP